MASFFGKILLGLAAAFGAAAVAKKYTEPPSSDQADHAASISGAEPPDGLGPDGTGAPTEAQYERARLRPGWSRPKPEVIPEPTYWPALFALGIAFLMWGIISNIFIFGFGLIVFVVSLTGWIGDLLHEFA